MVRVLERAFDLVRDLAAQTASAVTRHAAKIDGRCGMLRAPFPSTEAEMNAMPSPRSPSPRAPRPPRRVTGCTQETQNEIGRTVRNWTGTNGVLEVYAGDKLVKRFMKIDKLTTATGTKSGEPRPYRFGYGVLDADLDGQPDPGGNRSTSRSATTRRRTCSTRTRRS